MSKDAQGICCSFRGRSATTWDIIQGDSIIGEVTTITSGGYVANLVNRGSYSGYGKVNLDEFFHEVTLFLNDPNFMG